MNGVAQGMLLGFSIAAPVGPLGVLCIRRTLVSGPWIGLMTGLGAATADAFYGCIAGLGLTLVTPLLTQHQVWIRAVGGVFLCGLGLRLLIRLREPPAQSRSGAVAEETPAQGRFWADWIRAYGSALALTLTNPATILSFTALFAGLGLGSAAADRCTALCLILGVFLGSGLWWMLLAGGTGVLRTRLTPHRLRWIDGISGIVITGFGVLTLTDLGQS